MTNETHARIAALVAAGFLMTSGGAAFADTATSGNGSIGGGNQLGADVDAPINLCGNAIGLLGVAGAQCTDSGASVEEPKVPEHPDEPEEPKDPEEPGNPGEPKDPEEPGGPGEPEHPDEPGSQTPDDQGEEPGHVPDEISAPSESSPVEEDLAVTGTERGPLVGLIAAAVGALAVGAGLLFGLRRRAGA
ncbi:chaplin family protein [Nocardiopsis kunsanensis]|uniref:chaplin family protein n=1 Tax=Nocardiopsis kunsanensis TaxID=141693 RepID=UPI0003485DD9|nr:chaplin family protein [Nocardiopsis kunsanensis]